MGRVLKIFLIFISLFFAFTPSFANTDNLTANRIQLLKKLKHMYEKKHFNPYLFDIKKGYLQTAISNNEEKMPFKYFVKYNDMWWFQIITKVNVPSIAYNSKTGIGFIILNIYYGHHILRAMQYVKFKNHKISYIRTYGSPTFWESDDPLIKLDRYGNQIWLTTGYNLNYSAKAAYDFFDSPVGKAFANNSETSFAVKNIKRNLKIYLKN